MIAHRICKKAGSASFKRLGLYILDLKSPDDPRAFERLTRYVVDKEGTGERVLAARVTNCVDDDIEMALKDIELVQRMNTRSRSDKSYHLVISFREGERPQPHQLRDIEDHLVAAIGLSEHQRISAVHDDTDNLHIHVAINKVHPKTYRNVEPFHDMRRLMEACREVELRYGLQRDNHGLSADREGRIEARIDRAEKMEIFSGRESFATWVKDRTPDILDVAGQARTWQALHEGLAGVGLAIKPRGAGLVITAANGSAALKASQVDRSLSSGALSARLGPFAPARAQTLSQGVTGYTAGPRQRGADDLYRQYKAQRETAEADRARLKQLVDEARNARRAAVLERFEQRRKALFADPYLTPELRQRQLNGLRVRRAEDLAGIEAETARQRTEANRAAPLFNWTAFLHQRAIRSDYQALRLLRQTSRARSGPYANLLTAADRTRFVEANQMGARTVSRTGDVTYLVQGTWKVVDRAREIRVDTDEAVAAGFALSLAVERFGDQPFVVTGSDAFKAALVACAVEYGDRVKFADPALERVRQASLPREQQTASAPEPELSGAPRYIAERNALVGKAPDVLRHRLWTPKDAGWAIYAGRRTFSDGSEGVLLRRNNEIQVLPVSSTQAAKASTWIIGQGVATDERARFVHAERERSQRMER